MKAATHQMFGLTFGLAAISFFPLVGLLSDRDMMPQGMIEIVIFFGLVLFGSLLPDLDTPKSRLGRKLWFVSIPMNLIFGHRKMTHSLLFIVLVWIAGTYIVHVLHLSPYYAYGMALGVLSHVMGDGLTSRGVPLFYPLYRKSIAFPVTFRTGGFREGILAIVLVVVNMMWILVLTS